MTVLLEIPVVVAVVLEEQPGEFAGGPVEVAEALGIEVDQIQRLQDAFAHLGGRFIGERECENDARRDKGV